MKSINHKLAAAALGSVLLLAGCSSAGTPVGEQPTAPATQSMQASAGTGVQSVAVQSVAADQWLIATSDPAVKVIDVRTAEEFAAGHIAGATNLSVDSADFATQLQDLDKSATYAVYCRSGRRSALAASQMAAAGFSSIVNLQGGLADLQSAGATVVTG